MTNSSEASQPAPASTPSLLPEEPALPKGYTLHSGYPPVPDYLHLRAAAGLSPKTPAQAAPVARNSWYGCYVTYTPPDSPDSETTASASPASNSSSSSPTIVAMGRIIADGGWYFHVTDMAVLPAHQRRGLGGAVLRHLLARIRTHAPRGEGGVGGAYVTLFADAPGRRLYARHGFVETTPGQVGMIMPLGWEGQ
jgi:ribosomal protein S18 acetylase RimI-like enzyme